MKFTIPDFLDPNRTGKELPYDPETTGQGIPRYHALLFREHSKQEDLKSCEKLLLQEINKDYGNYYFYSKFPIFEDIINFSKFKKEIINLDFGINLESQKDRVDDNVVDFPDIKKLIK